VARGKLAKIDVVMSQQFHECALKFPFLSAAQHTHTSQRCLNPSSFSSCIHAIIPMAANYNPREMIHSPRSRTNTHTHRALFSLETSNPIIEKQFSIFLLSFFRLVKSREVRSTRSRKLGKFCAPCTLSKLPQRREKTLLHL
jgi:hypothetical protein